jgi:predicted nucleotidyltransferase component of viral defense system
VNQEYADLPEDASVRVYALEEIAIEKLVALTDRARNEPRDLYDLWHLTSEGLIDFATLIPERRGEACLSRSYARGDDDGAFGERNPLQ